MTTGKALVHQPREQWLRYLQSGTIPCRSFLLSVNERAIIIHREVYASVTRRVMAARDKSSGSRGTAVSHVPSVSERASRVSIFVAQPAWRFASGNRRLMITLPARSVLIALRLRSCSLSPLGHYTLFADGLLIYRDFIALFPLVYAPVIPTLGMAGKGGGAFRFATGKRKSVENRVSELCDDSWGQYHRIITKLWILRAIFVFLLRI